MGKTKIQNVKESWKKEDLKRDNWVKINLKMQNLKTGYYKRLNLKLTKKESNFL